MHLHLVFLAIALLLSGDGECTDYIVPVEWPATGYPPSLAPGSPRIRPSRRRTGGRPSRPGGEGTGSPAPRRCRGRPLRDRTRTRTLARISHQASAAAADTGMPTALRSVGLLVVVSTTSPRPSGARLVSTPLSPPPPRTPGGKRGL